MTVGKRHPSLGVEFEHTQIGYDLGRTATGQTQPCAFAPPLKESRAGHEINFGRKSLAVLLGQYHCSARVDGNFACSAAAGQSHLAIVIRSDDRRIYVAEL